MIHLSLTEHFYLSRKTKKVKPMKQNKSCNHLALWNCRFSCIHSPIYSNRDGTGIHWVHYKLSGNLTLTFLMNNLLQKTHIRMLFLGLLIFPASTCSFKQSLQTMKNFACFLFKRTLGVKKKTKLQQHFVPAVHSFDWTLVFVLTPLHTWKEKAAIQKFSPKKVFFSSQWEFKPKQRVECYMGIWAQRHTDFLIHHWGPFRGTLRKSCFSVVTLIAENKNPQSTAK